jgi:UDP-glucose 4-epimerase
MGTENRAGVFAMLKTWFGPWQISFKSPEAMGRVINIGNNEEISINRLAQKVKELAESFSPIVHIPYEKAYAEGFEDMTRRGSDPTLARNLIGFQPRYSLDDILLDVVDHFTTSSSSH